MALEDGEYRINVSVISRKTSLRPECFLGKFSTKKTNSTVFSGLLVHLVLFQSDNNKTELLSEMLLVEIINYTEKETHGANEDYNSL